MSDSYSFVKGTKLKLKGKAHKKQVFFCDRLHLMFLYMGDKRYINVEKLGEILLIQQIL